MKTKNRILFNSDAKFMISKVDGKTTTLVGRACVWNVLSDDRGGYFVRLLPGSANFITPTFALVNHDYGSPLARNDDGTLRILSDDYGVLVEIDLPDTTVGRDIEVLVSRGTIRGMSFCMKPGGDYTTSNEDGKTIITFSSFTAEEVTITPIPAFNETSIEVSQDDDTTNLLLEKSSKELGEQYMKLQEYKLDMYRF